MADAPPPWAPPPQPPPPPGYGHPYGYAPAAPLQQEGSATASLVLGIVSLTACVAVGWLPGGIAIFLGRKAQKAIDADPARLTGRGLANAGIITGICGCVLGVLVDLFYVGVIALSILATPS